MLVSKLYTIDSASSYTRVADLKNVTDLKSKPDLREKQLARCVAVWCSVLQCVAVCCSVL